MLIRKLYLLIMLIITGGLILSCSTSPVSKSSSSTGIGGASSSSGSIDQSSDLKLKMGLETPSSLKLKLKSMMLNHTFAKRGRGFKLYSSADNKKSRRLTRGSSSNTSWAYDEITTMVSNMGQYEGYAAVDLVTVYSVVSNLSPGTVPYSNITIYYTSNFISNVMTVVPDKDAVDTAYLDDLVSYYQHWEMDPFLYSSLSGDTNYDYRFSFDPDEDFNISWSSNWTRVKTDYSDTNGGFTNGYIFTYDDAKKAGKMIYIEQFEDYSTYATDQYIQNLSMKQDTNSSLHGVWVAYTENYRDSQYSYSYQTVGYADDSGGFLNTTYTEHELGHKMYKYIYLEGFDAAGSVFESDSEDGSNWTDYLGSSNAVNATYYGKYDNYSNEAASDNADNSAVQSYYDSVYTYIPQTGLNGDEYFYIYATNLMTAQDIIDWNTSITDYNFTITDSAELDRLYAGYLGDGWAIDTNTIFLDFTDTSLTQGSPLYLFQLDENWLMSTNCITNTNYGLPTDYRALKKGATQQGRFKKSSGIKRLKK